MAKRFGILALILVAGITAFQAIRAGESNATPPAPVQSAGFKLQGSTMGGDWSVRLGRSLTDNQAARLTTIVQRVLDDVDAEMSTWKSSSTLSKFNASRNTDWFPVSMDLAKVAHLSRQVSEETGGTFDITVGPLVNLWGFGPGAAKDRKPPSSEEIAIARRRVGYMRLEVRLNPPALRKLQEDLYVDLSAIAQGYAADLVATALDSEGMKDYLVNVCGEMRAKGTSPQEKPWCVGIQTPTTDTWRVMQSVQLRDVSFATSGDYQNFFAIDGVRYSHEIDPRSGAPIQNGLASVSVAHASAGYADAMATAMMVLGPDEGYALASQAGLAALFIIRRAGRFEIRMTPAFEPLLLADEMGK